MLRMKERAKGTIIYRYEARKIRDIIASEQGRRSRIFKPSIGCSGEELAKHIESLWKPGMNWDNYGYHGWHIDHIKPAKAFDLTDPVQRNQYRHYTNLQPLWKDENLAKAGRF